MHLGRPERRSSTLAGSRAHVGSVDQFLGDRRAARRSISSTGLPPTLHRVSIGAGIMSASCAWAIRGGRGVNHYLGELVHPPDEGVSPLQCYARSRFRAPQC